MIDAGGSHGHKVESWKKLRALIATSSEPLNHYHKGGHSSLNCFEQKSFVAKPEGPYGRDFETMNAFRSVLEYLTIVYAASMLDRAGEVEEIKKYEGELQKLVLVNIEKSSRGDLVRSYYGLIPRTGGKYFKLQAGDKIQVRFSDERSAPRWPATVVASAPVTREGMVAILL